MKKRKEPKLLPCPFCGNADITNTHTVVPDFYGYRVTCENCHAAASVEAWNRRAETPEARTLKKAKAAAMQILECIKGSLDV